MGAGDDAWLASFGRRCEDFEGDDLSSGRVGGICAFFIIDT